MFCSDPVPRAHRVLFLPHGHLSSSFPTTTTHNTMLASALAVSGVDET